MRQSDFCGGDGPLQQSKTLQKHRVFATFQPFTTVQNTTTQTRPFTTAQNTATTQYFDTLALTGALQLSKTLQKHMVFATFQPFITVQNTATQTRPFTTAQNIAKTQYFDTLALTGALQLPKSLQKDNVFDPYAEKTPYNCPKHCNSTVFLTLYG